MHYSAGIRKQKGKKKGKKETKRQFRNFNRSIQIFEEEGRM